MSLVQPGRFTMPGDLAGSELLQFCPLPHGAASRSGRAASRELMAERYERYRDTVVRSFYRDHFSRFDRQIVLVDLLGALNRGRACFADVEAALGHRAAQLPLRPERPARAAVPAADRDAAVRRQQGRPRRPQPAPQSPPAARADGRRGGRRRARFEGVKPAFVALAALRSTDVVRTEHHGQALSCVRGILKGENRETVLFPGEIPPDLPAEEDWQRGPFPLSRLRAAPPACCTVLPSRSTSASTRRSRCCSAIACNERAPAGRALRARSGKDRARAHRGGRARAARCRWWPRRPRARATAALAPPAGARRRGLPRSAPRPRGLRLRRRPVRALRPSGRRLRLLLALAAAGASALAAARSLSLRRLTALEHLRVTGERLLGSRGARPGRSAARAGRAACIATAPELQGALERFHGQASDALNDGERCAVRRLGADAARPARLPAGADRRARHRRADRAEPARRARRR